MIYLLIIMAFLFALILSVLLTARVVFRASRDRGEFHLKLTILNCGILYDISNNRAALVLGRWRKYLKLGGKKEKAGRKAKSVKEKSKAGKRSIGQLSWSARIRIVKAFLLYAGRFLSRIKYDEGQLSARPVMADPALAGMAYGFSAALHGICPGLRQTLDIYPDFSARESQWRGHLVFSIRIRQIVYISYHLVSDLPIKEIIKYWVKRGK